MSKDLDETKSIGKLSDYPSLQRLVREDSKSKFLNNNQKTNRSGCPHEHGLLKNKNGCILDCPKCWEDAIELIEWNN